SNGKGTYKGSMSSFPEPREITGVLPPGDDVASSETREERVRLTERPSSLLTPSKASFKRATSPTGKSPATKDVPLRGARLEDRFPDSFFDANRPRRAIGQITPKPVLRGTEATIADPSVIRFKRNFRPVGARSPLPEEEDIIPKI